MKGDICEICKDPFDDEEYRWKRMTHHIDGNHDNDDPENLMEVHFGCHSRLHGRKGLFILGKKFSSKHKKQISIANSGKNNPMFGKHHSEEAKRRISKANTGRKRSKESRDKQSKSLRGRRFSEEHKRKISEARTGTHHTEETKRKIGKTSKGRIPWNKGKTF